MLKDRRLIAALLLCGMLVLTPFAGVVGGTSGTVSTASNGEYIDATENISVWDRTSVSFRADTGATGAVTVDNLWLDAETERGDSNLHRDTLAVFQTDRETTLRFGEHTNTNSFGPGDDAQLLTGYLEDDVSENDVDDVPTTGQAVLDDLTSENMDNLNENVSFSLSSVTFEEDGTLTTSVTPDKPGLYMYVLATGSGLEVTNGDLAINGDTTIVGVEQFAAQNNRSAVTAPNSAEPGDDIEFAVNATEWNGSTSHTVVLYDEDSFSGSTMTINISEQLSTDLSADDVTVKHEITEVNGVQRIQDNVIVFGQSAESRTETGPIQFGDIVRFLANDADINEPGTQVSNDGISLDASSTAVRTEASTTLSVATYGNWTSDDYRWIHVASGSSSDQVQVNTGTLTIERATGGGGGGGGGGGVGGGGGDDSPDTGEDVTVVAEETSSPEIATDKNKSTVGFDKTTVEQITFNSANITGDVTSRDLDREPNETGPSPGVSASVFEIVIPDNAEDTSAILRTTVSADRVEEISADASDLRINRYNDVDGEWQGLSTTLVEERKDEVVLEAETPGFSYFSVSAVSTPTADAAASPTTIEAGNEVELDGSASENRYGEIVDYTWEINGQTFSGETVTTTLDESGNYTAHLKVTNDAGETASDSVTITVEQNSDEIGDGDGSDTDDGLLPVPGFGPIITVLALMVALLVFRHRSP
ncbi:PGF-pre-PGF domain-containing protein [Natrinema pallidum]|uniref:PGF-pre-PGF domain-containing protein n=1 Tax=Natrinema pallidum TaxID=69527 RepID=A0A4V1IFI2_9EURY|nr:PGF-pre-PGF domain-containing protein [Natrinema pallidum]QCW05084.1 PGF-pre-PGF domain-containing protein [Natrinema pallidum]